MRVVRAAATAALLSGVLLAGCGESGARRDARRTLTEQLVQGGLSESLAECVVDSFFHLHTDAELRAFYARETLTDDERHQFAELADRCADD